MVLSPSWGSTSMPASTKSPLNIYMLLHFSRIHLNCISAWKKDAAVSGGCRTLRSAMPVHLWRGSWKALWLQQHETPWNLLHTPSQAVSSVGAHTTEADFLINWSTRINFPSYSQGYSPKIGQKSLTKHVQAAAGHYNPLSGSLHWDNLHKKNLQCGYMQLNRAK